MSRRKPKSPLLAQGKRILAPHPLPPQGGTDHEPPIFCFKYTENGYNLNDLADSEKVCFVDKLYQLSQRAWRNIKTESRYKNGSETIARTSLKRPLPPSVTEDVEILAFHLPGLFRVLGWRNERILHILWLDTKGKLYSH